MPNLIWLCRWKKWVSNKKELVSFVAERDHKWPVVAAADAEYVGAERAV